MFISFFIHRVIAYLRRSVCKFATRFRLVYLIYKLGHQLSVQTVVNAKGPNLRLSVINSIFNTPTGVLNAEAFHTSP